MTDIIGTSGQDVLSGGSGDDVILGRGGDDFIYGGGGNDLLKGGAGGDVISDRQDIHRFGVNGDDTMIGGGGDDQLVSLDGADRLYGGSGNDDLVIYREKASNDDPIVARGGAGDDSFYLSSYGHGNVKLDGGAGDDYFELWGSKGVLHIDVGTGTDTVYLASRYADGDGPVAIKHFDAGAAGDHLDLLDTYGVGGFIDGWSGWDGTTDPFSDGYLELVQKGHNAVLEVDPLGAGNYHVAVVFQDANAADFTADNFSGFDPHPPAGLVT